MASRNLRFFQGVLLENIRTVYGTTGSNFRKISDVLLDNVAPAGTFPADPTMYWDFADGLTDVCAGHIPLEIVGMSGVTAVPGGFFINAIHNSSMVESGTGLVRTSTTLDVNDNYVISFWRQDVHQTLEIPTSRVRTAPSHMQILTPTLAFDSASWDPAVFHHFLCIVDNFNTYMYVDGQLGGTAALIAGQEANIGVGQALEVYMGKGGGLISELAVWLDYDLSSQQKRNELATQMWGNGAGIIWLDGAWEEIVPA